MISRLNEKIEIEIEIKIEREKEIMDKLPKDLIFKLTEDLSPQDFVNFCASNTSENIARACNMEEIWDKRLEKDFPYIIQNFDFTNKHKKEIYIRVFTSISDISDFLTNKILEEYAKIFKSRIQGIYI